MNRDCEKRTGKNLKVTEERWGLRATPTRAAALNERVTKRERKSVCLCVCVCERKGERERVCVFVREKECVCL